MTGKKKPLAKRLKAAPPRPEKAPSEQVGDDIVLPFGRQLRRSARFIRRNAWGSALALVALSYVPTGIWAVQESHAAKFCSIPSGLNNWSIDIEAAPLDRVFEWAENSTGVRESFLATLIEQESSGNWKAKNPESTAEGGGQIISSTWMVLMRQYGVHHGLKLDPHKRKNRKAILELRSDPRWAVMMSAHHARDNVLIMEERLGRQVTQKEAYLAHFFGVDAAVKALRLDAGKIAADVFPAAAKANQNVFYRRGNLERPRTIGDVIALQGSKFSDADPLIYRKALTVSKRYGCHDPQTCSAGFFEITQAAVEHEDRLSELCSRPRPMSIDKAVIGTAQAVWGLVPAGDDNSENNEAPEKEGSEDGAETMGDSV